MSETPSEDFHLEISLKNITNLVGLLLCAQNNVSENNKNHEEKSNYYDYDSKKSRLQHVHYVLEVAGTQFQSRWVPVPMHPDPLAPTIKQPPPPQQQPKSNKKDRAPPTQQIHTPQDLTFASQSQSFFVSSSLLQGALETSKNPSEEQRPSSDHKSSDAGKTTEEAAAFDNVEFRKINRNQVSIRCWVYLEDFPTAGVHPSMIRAALKMSTSTCIGHLEFSVPLQSPSTSTPSNNGPESVIAEYDVLAPLTLHEPFATVQQEQETRLRQHQQLASESPRRSTAFNWFGLRHRNISTDSASSSTCSSMTEVALNDERNPSLDSCYFSEHTSSPNTPGASSPVTSPLRPRVIPKGSSPIGNYNKSRSPLSSTSFLPVSRPESPSHLPTPKGSRLELPVASGDAQDKMSGATQDIDIENPTTSINVACPSQRSSGIKKSLSALKRLFLKKRNRSLSSSSSVENVETGASDFSRQSSNDSASSCNDSMSSNSKSQLFFSVDAQLSVRVVPCQSDKPISIDDFSVSKVLGKGAFGKVMMVQRKGTSVYYALKAMHKKFIQETNGVKRALSELQILREIDHPFIIKLHTSFQTMNKVYFLMECAFGGDVLTLLQRTGKLPVERVRFYGAQIALALKYLHERKIIYRDLKLENVLIDLNGYLKLADFGLAKKSASKAGRINSFCGTANYMAPEILLHPKSPNNYSYSVDWWSFGVVLYELLEGFPPFHSDDIYKIYANIVKKPVQFPPCFSEDARSLITQLLVKDPHSRLGSKLVDHVAILTHEFFDGLDMPGLLDKKIHATWRPVIPRVEDAYSFDRYFTSMAPLDSVDTKKSSSLLADEDFQKQFDDFDAPFSPPNEPEGRSEQAVDELVFCKFAEGSGLPVPVPPRNNPSNHRNNKKDYQAPPHTTTIPSGGNGGSSPLQPRKHHPHPEKSSLQKESSNVNHHQAALNHGLQDNRHYQGVHMGGIEARNPQQQPKLTVQSPSLAEIEV